MAASSPRQLETLAISIVTLQLFPDSSRSLVFGDVSVSVLGELPFL